MSMGNIETNEQSVHLMPRLVKWFYQALVQEFCPLGNSHELLLCCTDLAPGDFIHVIGDAHVYRNHVRPLEEQLQKLPKPFPVSIIIDRLL